MRFKHRGNVFADQWFTSYTEPNTHRSKNNFLKITDSTCCKYWIAKTYLLFEVQKDVRKRFDCRL